LLCCLGMSISALKNFRWAVVFGLLCCSGCASTTKRLGLPELETVPRVDLSRYLGTWFEIASIPQSFQRGCTGTRATYSLRPDGQIDVVNRCHKGSLDRPEDVATGRARVTDASTNSKLEVSFFRPFWGLYWVIQLGEAYDYAVVGHPSRDYLWILSRTPTMDPALYTSILSKLEAQRYPLDRLAKTIQPGGE
jgi:apolipoprotein D and lipocalin family protein